jgi:hypothetical protein
MSDLEQRIEELEQAIKAQHTVNLEIRNTLSGTIAALNNMALVIDSVIRSLKEHDIEVVIPEATRKVESDS